MLDAVAVPGDGRRRPSLVVLRRVILRFLTGQPVRNEARDVVAALNLEADSSLISLEEMVDALGPHLISTADRISARLGYRRDDERSA